LKDPSEGNPYELQALWFEIAQGEIFLARGEYPKAMRMFKFVQKAFMDIYEDQFDFHTYCLRRYSLNTYTRLLNYENGVYNQKPFVKACTLLIRSLMEYTSVRLVEVKECLTNQKSFLLNSFYVSKSSRRRKQKIYELRISVKWRKRNGKSNRN